MKKKRFERSSIMKNGSSKSKKDSISELQLLIRSYNVSSTSSSHQLLKSPQSTKKPFLLHKPMIPIPQLPIQILQLNPPILQYLRHQFRNLKQRNVFPQTSSCSGSKLYIANPFISNRNPSPKSKRMRYIQQGNFVP